MNLTFKVTDEDAGERLEVFLSREVPTLSRRKARMLCESGEVRVNLKRGFAGQRTAAGDVIELLADVSPVSARASLPKQDELLKVLYEDEHQLAVEKRPGMPSVTLRNDDPL